MPMKMSASVCSWHLRGRQQVHCWFPVLFIPPVLLLFFLCLFLFLFPSLPMWSPPSTHANQNLFYYLISRTIIKHWSLLLVWKKNVFWKVPEVLPNVWYDPSLSAHSRDVWPAWDHHKLCHGQLRCCSEMSSCVFQGLGSWKKSCW